MPEGVDERTFDEEDWSFGEQQFASGELLRKNIELERLLVEEKKRSEAITEREETKWKDQVAGHKERADGFKEKWQRVVNERQDLFNHINEQLQGTKNDLKEADARAAETMDELIERDEAELARQAFMDVYDKRMMDMYTSLTVQAAAAEKRWLLSTIVFQFLVDMMGGDHGKGGGLDVHNMELNAKAMLIRCKDVFLYNGALPIWHEPLKEQLKGRTARDILGFYFSGDANAILTKKPRTESADADD